jgi:hypothetical protein
LEEQIWNWYSGQGNNQQQRQRQKIQGFFAALRMTNIFFTSTAYFFFTSAAYFSTSTAYFLTSTAYFSYLYSICKAALVTANQNPNRKQAPHCSSQVVREVIS